MHNAPPSFPSPPNQLTRSVQPYPLPASLRYCIISCRLTNLDLILRRIDNAKDRKRLNATARASTPARRVRTNLSVANPVPMCTCICRYHTFRHTTRQRYMTRNRPMHISTHTRASPQKRDKLRTDHNAKSATQSKMAHRLLHTFKRETRVEGASTDMLKAPWSTTLPAINECYRRVKLNGTTSVANPITMHTRLSCRAILRLLHLVTLYLHENLLGASARLFSSLAASTHLCRIHTRLLCFQIQKAPSLSCKWPWGSLPWLPQYPATPSYTNLRPPYIQPIMNSKSDGRDPYTAILQYLFNSDSMPHHTKWCFRR